MKRTLSFLIALFMLSTVSVMAEVSKFYVNPIENDANLNSVACNRLFQKGMMGMTRARQAEIASGDTQIAANTPAAAEYDYIMTLTVSKAEIGETLSQAVNSLTGSVKGLFGKSSSTTTTNEADKDNQAEITVDVIVVDAKTGQQVLSRQEMVTATDKDKDYAYFLATENFDYVMLDFIDDVVVVAGEIKDLGEVSKKQEVETILVNVGFADGLRKDLMFDIYVDGNIIGKAKCDQVVAEHEAILSVYDSKKGDTALYEAWQNNDGSNTFTVKSRAKRDILHNMFAGLDKVFAKSERSDYMDPTNRTMKPVVATYGVEIFDKSINANNDDLMSMVKSGLSNVTTINFNESQVRSIDAARSANIDGLITLTLDKVVRSESETTSKDGKKTTTYNTTTYWTMTGIDVNKNKWISMKTYKYIGSSTKNKQEADKSAISLMKDNVKKFAEDVFPVEGIIEMSVKNNKKGDAVDEASINIGSDIGVRKNMMFDIYVQYKGLGADSREELGTGKVKSVEAGNAVISVKGKKDGDKKLFSLLQQQDEQIEIIVVSRAYVGVMGFLDKVLQ